MFHVQWLKTNGINQKFPFRHSQSIPPLCLYMYFTRRCAVAILPIANAIAAAVVRTTQNHREITFRAAINSTRHQPQQCILNIFITQLCQRQSSCYWIPICLFIVIRDRLSNEAKTMCQCVCAHVHRIDVDTKHEHAHLSAQFSTQTFILCSFRTSFLFCCCAHRK